LAVSLTASAALAPRAAYATGQCDNYNVETYERFPDSFPTFAAGTLGVLRPTLGKMFLPVAYLYLTGATLDEPLRKQLVLQFEERGYPRPHDRPAGTAWLAARNKVPGVTALPQLPPGHNWEDNCLEDAFQTAARSLKRLQSDSQLSATEVRQWLDAQDVVFQNCNGGEKDSPPAIPSALPDSASPVLRAERDYQIAAAHFYSGNFTEAEQRFSAIAKNKASRWAPMGVYLQARANIRKTLFKNEPAGLKAALPLLEQLVNQPVSSPEKLQAERLLGLVLFRVAPARYLKQITAELRQSSANYTQRLIDYQIALSLMTGDTSSSQDGPQSSDLIPLRKSDEMTDWVLLVSGRLPSGDLANSAADNSTLLTAILAHYDQQKTLPWLVAALMWLQPGHPRTAELTAAAAQVPTKSPGYDTLTYYSMQAWKQDPATASQQQFGKRLAAELKAQESAPPSTLRNQLRAWALERARTLEEALPLAMRFVLGQDGCEGVPQELLKTPPSPQKATLHLVPTMEKLLSTQLTLASLAALLDKPPLTTPLKDRLAQFIYARGLLLGETDPAVRALTDRLESTVVKSENWKKHIAAVHNAKSEAERRFAIGLLFLNEAVESAWALSTGSHPWQSDSESKLSEATLALVKADERAKATKEQKPLDTLKSPLRVATEWTIQYGMLHPEDERIPAALLRINKRSKYAGDSPMSKRAFEFMHKTYPAHPLTKQVKYWF